ncbi:hypothetical protein E8E14_006463 [Neopestalotiopsis sp. 37M]|nr:hypothetical protein E8E14_006463 [Neopestalotiopsis sp. 37M]
MPANNYTGYNYKTKTTTTATATTGTEREEKMEDAAIAAPHTVSATPEWWQYRYNAINPIYAIAAILAILVHGARWIFTTSFGP